jgi:hypothetical protein
VLLGTLWRLLVQRQVPRGCVADIARQQQGSAVSVAGDRFKLTVELGWVHSMPHKDKQEPTSSI